MSAPQGAPLPTIHRSKGLIVGVSCAAERLIFTHCDQRGARAPIRDIFDQLEAAGVPFSGSVDPPSRSPREASAFALRRARTELPRAASVISPLEEDGVGYQTSTS